MMMASPTAASPAATVMMKMGKIWPFRSEKRKEKATRLMFTALSISSMHIKTVIMLRRTITPTSPTVNMVPESIRKASVLGIARLLHALLFSHAIGHVGWIELLVVRLEIPFSDDDRADHCHQKKE